jgi:hypothetical protein
LLPANTERILARLGEDARVLDVGGWAAPFRRATHMLDLMPYETRGVMGGYGPEPERFSAETWTERDICAREPWPYEDGYFDFALCVTTLEDIRDPIWVCSELSRVANAGYVEVPTLFAELIYNVEGNGTWLGHEHHRWLVEPQDGGLVFTHKPHSLHPDWRVRVLPRWAESMTLEDRLLGLFWEGELPARERVVIGPFPTDELVAKVRARFRPTRRELALKGARERGRHLVARAKLPLRRAVERALARPPTRR